MLSELKRFTLLSYLATSISIQNGTEVGTLPSKYSPERRHVCQYSKSILTYSQPVEYIPRFMTTLNLKVKYRSTIILVSIIVIILSMLQRIMLYLCFTRENSLPWYLYRHRSLWKKIHNSRYSISRIMDLFPGWIILYYMMDILLHCLCIF